MLRGMSRRRPHEEPAAPAPFLLLGDPITPRFWSMEMWVGMSMLRGQLEGRGCGEEAYFIAPPLA